MDLGILSQGFSDFNMEELAWEDVRLEVQKCNSALFEVVEALQPNKKFTLIKAHYPYGGMIVDNGVLYLPHQSGVSLSLSEATLDKKIKKKLGYSTIPLALQLNKAGEVFVKAKERIIPLKFLSAGRLFGLFEITNLLSGLRIQPIWSVTSGARSIFMLPKVADKIGYQRLKKELNVYIDSPSSLADHWAIFKLISDYSKHRNQWHSSVLFFTDTWFEQPFTNSKWATFYNYLFRESTVQARFTRDDIQFDLVWQAFALAIGDRIVRPRPYILNTVKHLIAVGAGMLPGFRPADNSELTAPTQLLQDMYVDIYGLKHYLPTIMHAHNLMRGQELMPLYYSLAFPLLPEGASAQKPNFDIIGDARELRLLFEMLYFAVKNGKVYLPIANHLIEDVQYNYFHNGIDIYNEILSAKEIPGSDPHVLDDKKKFKDREFCSTAPFLGGCVQVVRKTHFAL